MTVVRVDELEVVSISAAVPVIQTATLPRPPGKKLSICLINPRFEPSYWGFEFALPL